MNRLFLKIFGWFWITVMLVSAVLIVVTMASLPVPHERPWDPSLDSSRFLRQGIIRNLNSVVSAYEARGPEALQRRLGRLPGLREIFIFDKDGNQIIGPNPAPLPVQSVIQKLSSSERSEITEPPFLALKLTSESGNEYQFVLRETNLRRVRGQMNFVNRFRASAYDNLTGDMALGIIAVIVMGGILCFFLARHLTTPISKLRNATQALTAGNLSARIGSSMGRRNDELGDLSSDFDLMAEQIEKLLKSQVQLIRDISHELRSPLARLNVALELARASTEENRGPALDRIEQESFCLNNMIGQILTLSRMESGTVDSRTETFKLGEVLDRIASNARYESINRNIEVQLIRKKEVLFSGYQSLIESALENVVRNAVKYTRDDSVIRIALDEEKAQDRILAVIEVSDQGDGIPESELKKIFTPFYRLEPSRDRVSGGSGIGLAITERAVRLHNGTVMASNLPEGGLKISIKLPVSRTTG